MTLGELRDLLRLTVFDDSSTLLSNDRANRLLNIAMRYAAGVAFSRRPELFLWQHEATIANQPQSRVVLADLSGEPFGRSLGVVRAERVAETSDTIKLPIIRFVDLDAYVTDDPSDRPAVFAYNQTFGFARPVHNLQVRVWYYAALDDMVEDSDSPGMSAGVGVANLLPQEYQALIVPYAALLAMASSNLDTSQWERIVNDQKSWTLAHLPARIASES